MHIFRNHWGLFVALIVSTILIVPFFHQGFFPMHDDTQPSRVHQMAQSLKDGMFPVRWVADLGYGYGYPIFNFYAPLPYYLGALLYFVGFDLLSATKIMMAIPIILAGISMYFFARGFFSTFSSSVAAIVYLLYPYFAVNIFVRGAVGEYFAYSLLPLFFLGVLKVYERTNIVKRYPLFWVIFAGFFLALIIITHNLTVFMVLTIMLFFSIFSLIFHNNRIMLGLSLLGIGLLALLLSAFYIFPAVLEAKYTNVSSQVGGGADYKDHFVCPVQLWSSEWGYGGSTKTCIDGLSFRLGKGNIGVAILSIAVGLYIFAIKRKREKVHLYAFSVFLFVFSLFMTTNYARAIWDIVPFMSYLQYPWRFLNFAGLAIALLAGLFMYLVSFLEKKVFIAIAGIGIVFSALFFNYKLFSPQDYNNRSSTYYSSKQALHYAISKTSDEYLPKGTVKPKNADDIPKEPITIAQGAGIVDVKENRTGKLLTDLFLNSDSRVRLNKAYFPTWKLFVNDNEVSYDIEHALLVTSLPQGSHEIRLEFVQTPVQKIANGVSIIGLLLLVLGIIYQKKRLL